MSRKALEGAEAHLMDPRTVACTPYQEINSNHIFATQLLLWHVRQFMLTNAENNSALTQTSKNNMCKVKDTRKNRTIL